MTPNHYWDLLGEWNDSHEPGVHIVFRNGWQVYGIARNGSYGYMSKVGSSTACVSVDRRDYYFDIKEVVAVAHCLSLP